MQFKPRSILLGALVCLGVHAQFGQGAAPGQTITALRGTELRADKLSSAPVLQNIPTGTALRMLSMEGGWVLVQTTEPIDKPGARLSGWVRASAVNLQPAVSSAAGLPNGREAGGNTALALGVRSLPPRINRHALIVGISHWADPTIPPLPGVPIDRESATQMAQAMQVPASNISYLKDEQATGDGIRQALKELTDRVQDGDRVFIHYSGHGTRFYDAAAGGCVEALLAYDGGWSSVITNHEMADLLKTITNKTDKLFVMYDACHSGGVVQAASNARTRGIRNANDEGALRPKFAGTTEECARPVNVKTRNLLVEATSAGALPQDIIHVSAARDNEISFDDELKGGLATQFMRDCMLRDAKDLDNSGAISMNEITQCAQEKIDKRMAHDANYKPHHLVLNGNAAFVPAWFSEPSATPVVAAPLSGEQALRQMFDQRDAKRRVQVTASKSKLKIGQDALELSVQSDRTGYLYVALAGSDNKSVYVLFPNELDKSNRIEAGQQFVLPRPNWRAKASGPAGTDNLLVMVTDGPRDLASLASAEAGPFVASLNDAQGRAKLGTLLTTSQMATGQSCSNPATRLNNRLCSDAYGASMIAVEETK